MNRKTRIVAALTLSVSLAGGCATKAGSGALIGGASGAAVGSIIGHTSHGRTGSGALIGAGVGALGGALVGNAMDKSDEEKKRAEEQRRREQSYSRDSSGSYNSNSYAPSNTAPSSRVTRANVMDWAHSGVKDEIIIDRIQRSGSTFYLTATDEKQLRDAGVGQSVIQAMKDTAK